MYDCLLRNPKLFCDTLPCQRSIQNLGTHRKKSLSVDVVLMCQVLNLFHNNAKYRKESQPKYRRVREKAKWKKLSRKDGSKSRHVAWAQLLWRSFGVRGWVCHHCGGVMRLRAVAIYPPATTKILRGLGVRLMGIGFTGPP